MGLPDLCITCSAYIGPWWPVKAAVILSCGFLALRLQERITPCSVPTINLVGWTHTKKSNISFELKLPLFLVLWSHHCGFILQCNASQHSSRFVAGKLQGEGLDWLHKFTNIPPHHLPVCRCGEYIRTCVCGRKGGKRGGEGWWD